MLVGYFNPPLPLLPKRFRGVLQRLARERHCRDLSGSIILKHRTFQVRVARTIGPMKEITWHAALCSEGESAMVSQPPTPQIRACDAANYHAAIGKALVKITFIHPTSSQAAFGFDRRRRRSLLDFTRPRRRVLSALSLGPT
ncbi:hypothetical protein HMF7854_11010 [Sphingomonas ginkgonis]|uniref:Uncharacterized protein n=1 Tax=Sphingomonas ginkgonis TaxID=2315330 RepID=A0A429VBR6_9SPHN|nr:hypothetical protein [Sphingomonas ginkgonis]RST31307.1 hypothetical protein HMF7854_11010 [Sphingomonas ginkgonis]